MLRQRPVQHKRKNSQLDLFYPSSKKSDIIHTQTKSKQKKSSNDKKLKLSLEQNKPKAQGNNILKLVQNSQKRAHKKETVIEDINEQNQWINQNIDCSNGACMDSECNSCGSGQIYDPYFQFGKKGRFSSVKKQNFDINYGYLNMEEITQVPDTMSNQRRYDSSNFYQFPTSNQNSLINFSNKLIEQQKNQNKCADTLEPSELKEYPAVKLIQDIKHLKKRKEKLPKNIVVESQDIESKFDLSELGKVNKKSKMFFVNKKDDKRSKSKQNLSKVEKEKSRSSLFLTKKSKNLSQVTLGGKKKSLSLKNEQKNQLKISQKKPKSFQKQKDLSQTKSSQQFFTNKQQSKSQKSSQKPLSFQKPMNLQIGQKIMMIESSQTKLQNQYKVLWQCMGELWENSRITRYISEKNKSDIIKLKEGQKTHDQKMIKLKSEILSSISSARY